jgi:hypothetical protein
MTACIRPRTCCLSCDGYGRTCARTARSFMPTRSKPAFVEAHAGLVGEALQFSLPEPQSLAVRAAALVGNLRLRYLVDQCRCRFEIGGCEALGKPLVHWHQKLTCLFAPSLVTPQSGEVGGATQFP